jgi:hypothetical protein
MLYAYMENRLTLLRIWVSKFEKEHLVNVYNCYSVLDK